MATRKTILELSIESRLVYNRLLEAEPGSIITYKELSTLIGSNVQNGSRFALTTACRKLMNDDRRVYKSVRNIGIKRLDNEAIVAAGDSMIKKIRKAATRGCRLK